MYGIGLYKLYSSSIGSLIIFLDSLLLLVSFSFPSKCFDDYMCPFERVSKDPCLKEFLDGW